MKMLRQSSFRTLLVVSLFAASLWGQGSVESFPTSGVIGDLHAVDALGRHCYKTDQQSQGAPAPPTMVSAQAVKSPAAVKPNFHIVARHAEGWYPGAQPRLIAENHSWLARHLLGRHNSARWVIPPPPAGVRGCHAQECVFADNSTHNLRTNGGIDWQAGVMSATSQPAPANYIALSNNATSPAASDCAAGSTTCTLTSEITTNGLARHIATQSHSNGTNTWAITYTWTAGGTQSVQEAGMFNASSSGTMAFEAAFTQVNLVSTDTFTATWTVTY